MNDKRLGFALPTLVRAKAMLNSTQRALIAATWSSTINTLAKNWYIAKQRSYDKAHGTEMTKWE